MFKFLRSQAKIFYWVIAATFILFLFLGGLTGRGCQAPGSKNFEAGVIGSVNGMKIPYQFYDMLVRQETNAMRQQNPERELNANQIAVARDRAWDAIVQNALVEQAIEDQDIKVSDEEVLDVFQNSPPPALLAQYRTEAGTLDMDRYYADLQNPAVDWSRAEEYVRNDIPRRKLYEMITADAVVSEDAVREEYLRQTGRAVAEFVGVIFAELGEDFTPSDEAVSTWYEAHPEDFQREEQARGQAVRFLKNPSDADFAEVLEFANEIRQELVAGQIEFAVAATDYSEDPGSAARGGDLGRFDRNRMVAPFSEAAFGLPVGEISQPVKTKFGYHLIEVTEQHPGDDGEINEVTARHILFKVSPGPDTLDLIRQSAEDFRTRVTENTFVTTAEAEAMDLVGLDAVSEGRDLPSLSMTLLGSNWLFAAEAGEISPVFENTEFCYVVLAQPRLAAGVRPLEEVKGQVVLELTKQHRREAAKAVLDPAVGEIQMGADLAVVAATHNLKHAVSDTFTINGNVADVGYGTDFNKLVIEGEVGTLIPEIETARGLYAAVPRWIQPFDQADFLTRSPNLQATLLTRAQNEAFTEWMEEQKAAAKIDDLRHVLAQGS